MAAVEAEIYVKGQGLKPVSQASNAELKAFISWKAPLLERDPTGQWADKDRRSIEAAKTVLDHRAESGDETAGEVKYDEVERLGEAMHEPSAISAALSKYMAGGYNLLSPQTAVNALPPGCGVQISVVTIDPRRCHRIDGKLMPDAAQLRMIGRCAGIVWQPQLCSRDLSTPNRVIYEAVGRVRDFDNTWFTVSGVVDLDMREDSDQVKYIRLKAKAKYERACLEAKRKSQPAPPKGDGGEMEIAQTRTFLLRTAKTRAELIAIANLGVARSYEPDDISRPFAIARLTWTGQTDDPLLKREFARRTAESFLGASVAAYGDEPQPEEPPRQLRAAQPDVETQLATLDLPPHRRPSSQKDRVA